MIRLTIVAIGVAYSALSTANAADLGGACCGDLEERVAVLEASTSRKGNSKVSLTLSGWVANQVTHWDDGTESNAYVTGLGTALASRVRFTGEANIAPGWRAGYVIHLELIDSDSLTTDQQTPAGPGLLSARANSLHGYESYWFVQSDRLGKVSIGSQSPPSDNGAILVDGSGTLIPANWVISGAFSFKIRDNNGGSVMNGGNPLVWGATGACYPGDCLGLPFNIVRYDSPTWGGFSFSASWGADDIWDIGARYAAEHNGFKIAVAAFYGEDRDALNGAAVTDAEFFQVGAYAQHIATGLFGFVNYGTITDELRDAAGLDPDVWHFKAGIRSKITTFGATVPYGEYMVSEEGVSADSKFQIWGLGVVQELDAAAMSIFAKYRQYSFDDSALCANGCHDLEEFSIGGLISF